LNACASARGASSSIAAVDGFAAARAKEST
jgi:hypothetical protein